MRMAKPEILRFNKDTTMTWKAEVVSIEKQPDQPINILAHCRVFNTDTGESLPFDIAAKDLTEDVISQTAALRIRSLGERDANMPLLQQKVLTLPDVPTSEMEIAKQEYFNLAMAAKHLRDTFGDGDPRTVDAVALASARYKPQYIGL